MPLKRLLLVLALGLGISLACLLTLSPPVERVYAGPPAAGINDAPVVGLAQTFFDGALGTAPNQQGEFFFISFLGVSTQTPAPGYTTLDTTANMADYAGYTHSPPLHLAPVLDAGAGYALRFSARVISESHISPDRAGFSIAAISDTPTRSLELAFWEDEIWAQGTTPAFFTHAEGVAFDTTAGMVDYELIILGSTYSLLADNTEILSGSLRDYTGFSGPIDPYETSNLIFFGDNTTSAQAAIELANIEVVNNLPLPDRSTSFNTDLILDGIRALDVDAGSQDVVVTMTVNSGVLTAATGAPGGLTGAEISGNGTASLVLNGSIGQINHTLAASRGLLYRSLPAFTGLDPLTITIDDQGHSGAGSGKKRSTAFDIVVAALPCYATPNGGATLYSSVDAHAVQQAVDDPASTASGEVRVAGTCAGVETRSGLAQTVYINKPLALRGGYTVTNWLLSDPVANPTVLDAQGIGRVIFITDTVETTIENLMVTRGVITGNGLCSVITANCGGGILATGPLTLSNVIVFSNSAHRGGGGVAALTSTTISNSRFEQNVSTGSGGGGGLHAEGPVSLAGALFESNTSTLAGGAVQVQDHALFVSNSSFIRNQSLVNVGGAIRLSFASTGSGPLVISNSTFLSNTAGVSATAFSIVHGGAVYAFNAHVTATNSYFENNRCLTAGCDGGGIYIFGNPSVVIPVLRLVNTAIISNSGGRNGGGLFNNGQAFLTGGRFERNQITGGTHAFSEGGGGLYSDGAAISGTRFIDNISGEDGGGALVRANLFVSTASLSDTYFEGNMAANNGGGFAFGGFFLNPPVQVVGSQFISNSAGFNGGGWYSEGQTGGVTVTMVSNRFEGNMADGPPNDGGLIKTERGGGAAWVGGPLILSDTDFTGNTARANGGGLHARSNAQVNGGQFTANRALGSLLSFTFGGGGIYAFDGLVFTGTTFLENRALQGGGIRSTGATTGQGGIFRENLVDNIGGGLFSGGPLTLNNTQFISNTAITDSLSLLNSGAGAFASGESTLTNVIFNYNRGLGDNASGGGLYAEIATISGGQFVGNEATTSGGGVSLFGSGVFEGVLFQENTTQGAGGGLQAFIPFPGSLLVTGTQFISNTAQAQGGALSLAGSAHIISSTLRGNRSLGNSGGAIYATGVAFITDTAIISNTAAITGGGVYANSGARLKGGQFRHNVSLSGSGGGIFANSGMTVDGTSFVDNRAGFSGGGAFAGFISTVANALFDGNSALLDGGALWFDHHIALTGTTFIRNAASGDGGALYHSADLNRIRNANVVNNLFAGNQAGGDGLAIYKAISGTFELVHSTVASSTQAVGTAIYVVTGTTNITNSIITGHAVDIHVETGGIINEDFNLFPDGRQVTGGGILNVGGSSQLSGNPAFTDPATDDYHLTAFSPAINAGLDAGIAQDFEGDPRPQQGGFDIGYDESPFATPRPLFSILKTSVDAGGGLLLPGDTITYTITISNIGTAAATGVAISDTVPANTAYVPGSISGGDARDASNLPLLRWTVNSLPVSAAVTVTFAATFNGGVFSGTQIVNTASVTGSQVMTPVFASASNTAAEFLPDVVILKSVTPGVVFPGETVTYTIAFSNAGQGTAFGVIISDSVPVSVTGLSVTNSGAAFFDLGSPPDFVWGLEGLEPGQDGIITITGQISPALTGGGLFTNTAEIVTFGSETDTGNNTSGAGVQIAQLGLEADLAISKSRLGPNTVLPGSAITYTVTLTNNGPDSVNVTVTDTYTGAVVSGVNTTAAGGSCSSPVSPIICSFADFTGSATITFVFSTNPGLTGILSNSAAISPTNGLDPFPDNNQTGTITTSVAGVVQLPLVSFGAIAPTPLPEGDTAAVQISLDIASTQAITVSYGVSGGTATPGVDFIPLSGQLVFPAGTTVQTLTVTAISDSLNEGDETVELQLTAPQNAVLAADPLTATLTILDTTPQSPVSVIYLPLVMKENLVAPDLIVDVLLAATDGVTVVIKNVGNASVFNSFWVDAYVNPDPPPAGVNDVWHDGRSVEGVAWGVDDPLLAQLTPGGAITLTIDSAHPDFTVLDGFTPGDVVYVQVDSANLTATYGGVLEGHEISGGPYNNIVQTVVNPGPPAQIRSQWQFNAPTGDSLPDRPSNLLRYQHQYKLQIP